MTRSPLLALSGLVSVMLVVAVAVANLTARPTMWGGVGALFYYESLDQWRSDVVSQGSSVAVVRVIGVSDVRWSTSTSTRPTQQDVARVNAGEATFGIGRLVTLELVRQVDGTWPANGPVDYFLPGGQIGNDYTPPLELLHHLPAPALGQIGLATILPTPDDIDDSEGTLTVEVGALFPAGANGFLMTPNHSEVLQIDEVGKGN